MRSTSSLRGRPGSLARLARPVSGGSDTGDGRVPQVTAFQPGPGNGVDERAEAGQAVPIPGPPRHPDRAPAPSIRARAVPTQIRRERLWSPAAIGLITALNTELRGRYPNPVDCHFDLTAEEVVPGRGAFVVASEGGVDVGCGAVRLIAEGLAELKRLYVTPACRQRGIASAVLAFLESEARLRSARAGSCSRRGSTHPDGLALYRHTGYGEIEKFGPYADSLVSICMGKDLAATAH